MTTLEPPGWRSRRQHRRGPPAIERRTHIALADLLRRFASPAWDWRHIPNGEYRTPATGALLQRMGTKPGTFDFLFIGPDGRHYWLELKRDARADLSIEQLRFRRMLAERNVPFAVARSFDEAVAAVERWGVLVTNVKLS